MPEPDKILRMRSVLQRTGLSRATIYRKIKDGTFPCQVRISVHGCGWRESAINCWMADPEGYRACDNEQVLPKSRGRQPMSSSASPDRRPASLRHGGVS